MGGHLFHSPLLRYPYTILNLICHTVFMVTLILMIVFGLGVAAFALQNTQTVAVTLAGTPLTDVPLFLIVIGSLLLGIIMSLIISFIDSISSSLLIHRKNNTINQARGTIGSLEKKIHDLELENARLQGKTKEHENIRHEKVVVTEKKPSLLQRIRSTNQ